MEGKFELQFEDGEYYLVDGNSNDTVATTDKVLLKEYDGYMKKLSLKNCEVIANGYDLDELACKEIGIDISVIKHIDRKVIENDSVSTPIHEAGALGAGLYHQVKGFEIGFQKALEILSDKKFSEEDVKFMFQLGFNLDNPISKNEYDVHIQSLQQTEWNVEVEMECVMGCQNLILNGENSVCCGDKKPKLDANGCLILRRC